MMKIPVLSKLFREKTPLPKPEAKEAPEVRRPEPVKAKPSNELQLPADHIFYRLWHDRSHTGGRPPQPVLVLEGRSFPTDEAAVKELQRLRKAIETAASQRVKALQPPRMEEGRTPPPPSLDAEPVVYVSGDALDAWVLAFPPVGSGRDLDRAMLDQALAAKGVRYGLEQPVLDGLPGSSTRYFRIVHVARGNPAFHGADSNVKELYARSVEAHFTIDEHNRADYASLNNVQNVEAGGVICQIFPAGKGRPGTNVLGQEIPAKDGRTATIPKGRNTELNEDGTALVATIAGHVDYTGRVFQVKPLLEIPGNVDFSTGNINYLGDVVIHGDICGGFSVRAVGSITVEGVVEACTVEAGGDLILSRGVQGDSQAVVRAQRNMFAKYLENCCVYVKGSLQSDCIVNCDVYCNNEVSVRSGHMTIIGGTIRAGKKISAGAIGSRNEGRTDIFLGGQPCEAYDFEVMTREVLRLEAELEKTERQPNSTVKHNVINKLRMQLLMNRKRLEQLRAEQEKIQDFSDLEDRQMVCDTVYPGTVLTIGEISHRFDRKLFPCTASLVAGEIWLA